MNGPHGCEDLGVDGFLSVAKVKAGPSPSWSRWFHMYQSHRFLICPLVASADLPIALSVYPYLRCLVAPFWKNKREPLPPPRFFSFDLSVYTVFPSSSQALAFSTASLFSILWGETVLPGGRGWATGFTRLMRFSPTGPNPHF